MTSMFTKCMVWKLYHLPVASRHYCRTQGYEHAHNNENLWHAPNILGETSKYETMSSSNEKCFNHLFDEMFLAAKYKHQPRFLE